MGPTIRNPRLVRDGGFLYAGGRNSSMRSRVTEANTRTPGLGRDHKSCSWGFCVILNPVDRLSPVSANPSARSSFRTRTKRQTQPGDSCIMTLGEQFVRDDYMMRRKVKVPPLLHSAGIRRIQGCSSSLVRDVLVARMREPACFRIRYPERRPAQIPVIKCRGDLLCIK